MCKQIVFNFEHTLSPETKVLTLLFVIFIQVVNELWYSHNRMATIDALNDTIWVQRLLR